MNAPIGSGFEGAVEIHVPVGVGLEMGEVRFVPVVAGFQDHNAQTRRCQHTGGGPSPGSRADHHDIAGEPGVSDYLDRRDRLWLGRWWPDRSRIAHRIPGSGTGRRILGRDPGGGDQGLESLGPAADGAQAMQLDSPESLRSLRGIEPREGGSLPVEDQSADVPTEESQEDSQVRSIPIMG